MREADEARVEEGPRVVKTKRFAVKPTGIDEAVMQMDLPRQLLRLPQRRDEGGQRALPAAGRQLRADRARGLSVSDPEVTADATLHGVLVDVFGVGVLLLGESGDRQERVRPGPSLSRGHRLVADDMVEVFRRGDALVIGRGSPQARYHMEIRGLGIINVRDLFGVTAIRYRNGSNWSSSSSRGGPM